MNDDIWMKILIIAIVVALGMFVFNQWLSYKYKAQFLLSPCELCAKVNPNQSQCVEGCFRINANSKNYVINFTPVLENEKATP